MLAAFVVYAGAKKLCDVNLCRYNDSGITGKVFIIGVQKVDCFCRVKYFKKPF